MSPPRLRFRQTDTHRLIPSRYPPTGLFDVVSTPEDLPLILELEGWTNDRISAELGIIQTIPSHEWVLGSAHATVVMAAFCHPRVGGGRFNDGARGAWYSATSLETAIEETIFHKTKEHEEIGMFPPVQMRQYLADFDTDLHDVRASPAYDACHDPDSYAAGQAVAADLLASGSNGVLYRSVRHVGGECIACFRPKLVMNVRPGAHFEYRWPDGSGRPQVTQMTAPWDCVQGAPLRA